jgi:hypothetical protein
MYVCLFCIYVILCVATGLDVPIPNPRTPTYCIQIHKLSHNFLHFSIFVLTTSYYFC